MSTVGNSRLTFADIKEGLTKSGKHASIINLLSQRNSATADIPWVKANNGMEHVSTQVVELPSISYRDLNEGITPTKSKDGNVTFSLATMEDRTELDVNAHQIGSVTPKGILAKQARRKFSAMANQFEENIWYNNGQFLSFGDIYKEFADPSSAGVKNITRNVIDATPSGSTASATLNKSSIYVVAWGQDTIHGLHPANQMIDGEMGMYGIRHKYLGIQDAYNSVGSEQKVFRAHKDWFQWQHGLAFEDWRQGVRICNIDTSTFKTGTNKPDLLDLLIGAMETIEDLNMGEVRIYMNRTVAAEYRRQARKAVSDGGGLTYENVQGKKVATIDGTITRITDGLKNTEGAVLQAS